MITKKPNKYHNKVIVNALGKFDSKKEYERYLYLRTLVRRGDIKDLRRQVSFELIPAQGKEKACSYVADFVYFDVADGAEVVEDVKGVRTVVYRIKKKLMKYRYGVDIKEV